jgi:O-antigen/teichoic acid export membrane protein
VAPGFNDRAPHQKSPARIRRVWDRLRHALGVDQAILYTISARAWSSSAGLITVVLIARFLSPSQQGYYYTFSSLVAMQILFELGFAFVILQLASHERAHLHISSDYVITGDPISHARLASILQKTVRWYSIAAVGMLVTLAPLGYLFFAFYQHSTVTVEWRLPWYFAAIAATLNFQLDPILSFLEGCGYVANVARLRLTQAVVGSIFAWSALATHRGLFAPSMFMLGFALTSFIWLLGKRRFLLGLLRFDPDPHRIIWGKEVWPFQWKIAVSWICGYFMFQLFNPILFAFRGPVEAGQMGMSLSLVGALQAVAISWIVTKSCPFGVMIARKEYEMLDRTFFKAVKQATTVSLVGAAAIWIGAEYMNLVHFRFAQRLLPPIPLGILLTVAAVNIVVISEANYLRAHKQEKFHTISVISAILIALSAYFFGRAYGALGMTIGYLAVQSSVGLGFGTYTFVKYRRLWHAQ